MELQLCPQASVKVDLTAFRPIRRWGRLDNEAAGNAAAQDILDAAAALLADVSVPDERWKVWDFYSPDVTIMFPSGEIHTGWPSHDDVRAGRPNATFAALSALVGAESMLNLEWTSVELLRLVCFPLDEDRAVVLSQHHWRMIDHEADGRRGALIASYSDLIQRDRAARYGWVLLTRHIGPIVPSVTTTGGDDDC